MKRFVVDTSVAVKWFLPEIYSDAAARLLDPEISLSAPDLITSEIGNTLWKKLRRNELSRDEATDVLVAFETIGVEIHSSRALLTPAFHLAAALDRTVYDSMYLALAIAQDCALITADARFHRVVEQSPLAGSIRWIETALEA